MISKTGGRGLALFIAVTGILFALIGPFDMVYEGPFWWHIRQPAFWQGGIELLVLAALLGATFYFLTGWRRVLIVLILCELYARRQGVDLAILISLLYYESIAALGALILRRFRTLGLGDTEKCLFGIMVGTLTWSCIEWILSAIGPGSVHDLQIAALVVLGASLLLLRRLPVLSRVFSHVGKRKVSGALLGAFVCTVVLMLFAKASVSIDYDSLWYGVRGDRVLVAAGSVFKGLGLVSPVHYGPQAYELLLVPLTGLRSVTAILGFSIWCWVGLGVCLYSITDRLHWAPKVKLFAVALALATPAAMNIAITAKGDVMGATWVLFGAYAIIVYRLTRHRPWLVVAFFAALAATAFRMSVLPYAGLTGLFALCAFVTSFLPKQRKVEPAQRMAAGSWVWIAAASAVLFVLVTARTFLLAGVPFAEVSTLVNLSEHLGFSPRFPVGGPAPAYPGFNTGIVSLVLDFLFRPAKLLHIMIQWTGAAFAFFLLVGFALGSDRKERLQNTLILWLLAMTFPLLLLFVRYPIRGGDGNYFIVPILSMLVMGVGLVGRMFCNKDAVGRTLSWVAGLFVLSAVAVSLATGSWGPGTRGWDFDFSRTPFDYQERAKHDIRIAKLQLVDDYMKKLPSATRVVGIVPLNRNSPFPEGWLPVRYESLENIQWTRPGYLSSADAVEAFLFIDAIKYVILPKTVASIDASEGRLAREVRLAHTVDSAMKDLQDRGSAAPVAYGDHYVLWKLKD